MGVTQLWQILAPVEQHRALSSLSGQTIAVDLSIWVCENQCVKQMQGVVSKPYLRNLFFRISHLTQLGVKLVFVIEGTAPELKWNTMVKRQQSRFPGRQGKEAPQRPAGKQTRRTFNAWLKECCELLEILGIPYIQGKGEAEALCALLNASGLVDGCLTNDGDAFLYGATTVYRNFTMNTKDPHVEMYKLSDIQSKLGIDRGGFVALGLLIGCDFTPKGVPGIGIANAVRLLQSLHGQDVLMRLQSWRTMSERECVDQTETLARRKAIQVPDFPQIGVIDEFLVPKERCPSRLPEWKRPVPAKLQEFSLIKLEWPVEYTIEKVLPLITLWDMQDLSHSKNPSVHQHLKPHRIVKTRIRQGEPCYEVEWIKPVTDTVTERAYYVTIELQEFFTKCYPGVVKAFNTQSTESKKKPKAKKKKKKVETVPCDPPSLDNLSFQFEKVNLGQVTSKLQDSVNDLHPSFSEYDETALTTKAKQPRHLTLSPNGKKSSGSKGESSENRKPVTVPFSLSEETVTQSGNDLENSTFVPLSQRVKLRMQNKHGSNNKENEDKKEKVVKGIINDEKFSIMKSPGADLSNMSSLLEDIQNLSLKEADKFRHKTKGKTELGSVSKLHYASSPHILSAKQTTPISMSSRKMSTMKDFQKMSSPSTEEICTPMSYMKHKGALGDSFEIQKSPYYIENPFAPDKSKSDKKVIDISSPGFFSRPEPQKEPEVVDTRCAAEKLIEKIESGIGKVGSRDKVQPGQEPLPSHKKVLPKSVNGDEKITVESLMSILSSSSSGKGLGTPTQQLHKPKPKSSTPANQSGFGHETSLGQFGDFQIQHSLLDSLCSGLVQALTPKGVSMSKEEYSKLLNTLNEMGSEDDDDDADDNGLDEIDAAYEKIKCDIDFSELEKASSGFKNLNQKLLLKPIQIDDEDVMAKLSKSARKKLRRRERKRDQELQNLAQLKNVSKCKGKTKGLAPEQNSRRNSVKSSSSEDSTSNKKNDKRKSTVENGIQNSVQTKLERKKKYETKCVNKTNVKNNEKCNGSNLPKNKNSLSEICDTIETPPPEVSEENADQKLKKKKKKKRVKKASPLIDLSADDSILDDKKLNSCAEYLKKALENNQRKLSENKILKASPFMDVSADDTLLELEGLSCKVVGDELDSDLENKLKKKKRLSKEKLCSKYGVTQTSSLPIEPVLSMNDILGNESDQGKHASSKADEGNSGNSQSCNCEGHDKQEDGATEGAVDSSEKNEVNLEKEIKAEEVIENGLHKAGSPELKYNIDGREHVSSVIESDVDYIEDEIKIENQVKSRAANQYIRDLKYSVDASKGHDDDEIVKEPRNINRSKFDINGTVNDGANDEELSYEKDNIEGSFKCGKYKICNVNEIGDNIEDNTDVKVNGFVSDDNESARTVITAKELGSFNACPEAMNVVHNIKVENMESIDIEERADIENVKINGFSEDDGEILRNKEIGIDNEALNTYHRNGIDVEAETTDKTASVQVKNEKFVGAYNDFVVLNGAGIGKGFIDDNTATINGHCSVEDSEHRSLFRKHGDKMGCESQETNGNVRYERETAGLCSNKGIEEVHTDKFKINGVATSDIDPIVSEHINGIPADLSGMDEFHKVKIERNGLALSENGLSVSDHLHGIPADINGRDEDLVGPMIKVKSEVNGIERRTFSSDSSDDETELRNRRINEEKSIKLEAESRNGIVKEEKSNEEAESFNQVNFDDKKFVTNDINTSEVFNSPACLADRLKLRLRKTSTKNVLDMFTNGK